MWLTNLEKSAASDSPRGADYYFCEASPHVRVVRGDRRHPSREPAAPPELDDALVLLNGGALRGRGLIVLDDGSGALVEPAAPSEDLERGAREEARAVRAAELAEEAADCERRAERRSRITLAAVLVGTVFAVASYVRGPLQSPAPMPTVPLQPVVPAPSPVPAPTVPNPARPPQFAPMPTPAPPPRPDLDQFPALSPVDGLP